MIQQNFFFRYSHAVVTTTQGTFAVGGFADDTKYVEQFDVVTKQWKLIPGVVTEHQYQFAALNVPIFNIPDETKKELGLL